MDATNQTRLSLRPLWLLHPALYEAILALLVQQDPIGICHIGNPKRTTEYAAETDTILPRLKEAMSVDDVQRIVYEEFVQWFNRSAGPIEWYDRIAVEIWTCIQTPLFQGQLPNVVALPRQLRIFVTNMLNQYTAADPSEYRAFAQGLRAEAQRLEWQAQALERRLKKEATEADDADKDAKPHDW